MLIGVRAGKGGIDAIMRDYDNDRSTLMSLNSMPLESVREGMIVVVRLEDDIEHVVRPFETIESIAERYAVSPTYLRTYNNIDRVFLGDKIYIEKK